MLDPVFIAQVLTEDGLIVLDETVHSTYEDAAKSVLPLAAQHTPDEDVERQLLTPTERPLETLARLNEAGVTELTGDAITLDFPDEITLHGCLPLPGRFCQVNFLRRWWGQGGLTIQAARSTASFQV